MYIVCIETDSTDATWMIRTLQSQDHEVVLCAMADEGWMTAQGREPDVMIINHRMPDTSGLNLALRIRGLYPRCAIILTSAFLQTQEVIDVFRQGIDDVLIKPIPAKDLLIQVWAAKLHRQSWFSLSFTGAVPDRTSRVGGH